MERVQVLTKKDYDVLSDYMEKLMKAARNRFSKSHTERWLEQRNEPKSELKGKVEKFLSYFGLTVSAITALILIHILLSFIGHAIQGVFQNLPVTIQYGIIAIQTICVLATLGSL